MGPLRLRVGSGGRMRPPEVRAPSGVRRPALRRRAAVAPPRLIGGPGRVSSPDTNVAIWLAGALALLLVAVVGWLILAQSPSPPAAMAPSPTATNWLVPDVDVRLPDPPAADGEPSSLSPSQPDVDTAPDPAPSSTPAPDVAASSEPSELPTDSAGGLGGGGGGWSPSTFEREEKTHVHEWSILWRWQSPWWPLAALAALFTLLPRRRPQRPGRARPLLVAALGAALASLAFAAAVRVPDSSGEPIRPQPPHTEVRELESGNTEILTTQDLLHRHIPIEVELPWLFLGLGSSLLTVRGMRAYRSAPRRRRRPAAPGPSYPSERSANA